MRLRYESSRAIVLGFALVGILAGLGASYLITPLWEASAVVQIEGSGDRNLAAQQRIQRLMSRRVLASVVNDPRADLYAQERRSTPLEDVVDGMHLQLSVPARRPDLLRLRFDYPDPGKAVLAVNMLITKLIDMEPGSAKFQVIDAPTLPTQPVSPNRRSLMLVGLIAGVIAGSVTLLIRNRKSTPPTGLQTA